MTKPWRSFRQLGQLGIDPPGHWFTGWHEVGATAGRLRRDGRTLPLTDLVIAVSAARAGYALWSFDADFERIGGALGALELHGGI